MPPCGSKRRPARASWSLADDPSLRRPCRLQGALEGCQDRLVRLPEERRIHREVDLLLVVLIGIEEDPGTTQSSKEGRDVHVRVELDGEDVGAMWEASHPDALILVEMVNEGRPFGHGGAKTLHEPLGALQGQCRYQAHRCQ